MGGIDSLHGTRQDCLRLGLARLTIQQYTKQNRTNYRSLESCHMSADECELLLESHESLGEDLIALVDGAVEPVVGGPFSGDLPGSLDRVELG